MPQTRSADIQNIYIGLLKSKRVNKTKLVVFSSIVCVIIIISALLAGYAYSQVTKVQIYIPKECSTLYSKYSQYFFKNYEYVCGVGRASDGLLNVTLHNYHFALAKDIQFNYRSDQPQIPPDSLILLLNLTIVNIGDGNVSVGGGYVVTSNGTNLCGNSALGYSATFPNIYPSQNLADAINLPPGGKLDYWLLFYMPYPECQTTVEYASSHYELQFFIYFYSSYGGTYMGDHAYNCQKVACWPVHRELFIQPSNGTT